MKLNSRLKLALVRAYASEFVLALLAAVVFFATFSPAQIISFLGKTIGEWFAITGQVLFPAALVVWVTYVNLEGSEFGDYLRFRNAVANFQRIFSFPVFVFFFAALMLILFKGISSSLLIYPIVFLLNYSAILFVTMTRNLLHVIRLYGTFREELKKAQDHVGKIHKRTKY